MKDEKKENNITNNFIFNCIEDLKQKCTKENKLKLADVFNIYRSDVILIESECTKTLEEGQS